MTTLLDIYKAAGFEAQSRDDGTVVFLDHQKPGRFKIEVEVTLDSLITDYHNEDKVVLGIITDPEHLYHTYTMTLPVSKVKIIKDEANEPSD